MPNLNFSKDKNTPSVEIILHVRDKNGNPTGKTKSFDGNHRDVSDWYVKQTPKKKKRKKKKKGRQ